MYIAPAVRRVPREHTWHQVLLSTRSAEHLVIFHDSVCKVLAQVVYVFASHCRHIRTGGVEVHHLLLIASGLDVTLSLVSHLFAVQLFIL